MPPIVKATDQPVSFMRVAPNVWGVRSQTRIKFGQSVDIVKRSGETVRVQVGRLVRREGRDYVYAQLADGIDLPLPEPDPGLLNDCSMKAGPVEHCSTRSQVGGRPEVDPGLRGGRAYPERVCAAIVALARGMTVSTTARTVGLSRRRVRAIAERGVHMTPEELAEELQRARAAIVQGAVSAAQTLVQVSQDPTLDVFARVRAADSILDRALGKPAPPSRASAPADPEPADEGADLAVLRNALESAPVRQLDSAEE